MRKIIRINTCLLSVGHHKLNRGQNQLSFDDVIIKIFSVLFNSIFSSLNYTSMLYKSFSSHTTSLNREPGAREALTSIFRMSAQIASSILMSCYQWGSCFPYKTSTKEPMELAATNFHHRRPHRGIEIMGTFRF